MEFLVLWSPTIPVETFRLFKLPKKIKDEAYRWLYKPNSDRTRYALAAKITRRTNRDGQRIDETRHLLDFEPKQRKANIVILWTDSGRDLSVDDLRHIVRGFAQTKSITVNRTRMWNVRIGHRRRTVPPEEIGNGPAPPLFNLAPADAGSTLCSQPG